MKQITITDETYHCLLTFTQQQGLSEAELSEVADEQLRLSLNSKPAEQVTGKELIASFDEFRGMFQDATLTEILADRRTGLR